MSERLTDQARRLAAAERRWLADARERLRRPHPVPPARQQGGKR